MLLLLLTSPSTHHYFEIMVVVRSRDSMNYYGTGPKFVSFKYFDNVTQHYWSPL